MNPLRIATRKSPLALWQARHVGGLLTARHPEVGIVYVELSTEGDRMLGVPLSQIGGKGLFVKEIEQALLDGRADVAVHSLKDVPSVLPPGLVLAALPSREDPRDVWVSPEGKKLLDVPHGAQVGTSSLRRSCQLLEKRPDLRIVHLRGNVETRLKKAEALGLAGTILAAAGLKRLGLQARMTEVLEPETSLPAVGQGVLAIECRTDDSPVRALLAPLDDASTRLAVVAERAFLARLEGGCQIPLAGYAQLEDNVIRLRGLLGRPDGTRVLRTEQRAPGSEASQLGQMVAEALLSMGGDDILRSFLSGEGHGG